MAAPTTTSTANVTNSSATPTSNVQYAQARDTLHTSALTGDRIVGKGANLNHNHHIWQLDPATPKYSEPDSVMEVKQ